MLKPPLSPNRPRLWMTFSRPTAPRRCSETGRAAEKVSGRVGVVVSLPVSALRGWKDGFHISAGEAAPAASSGRVASALIAPAQLARPGDGTGGADGCSSFLKC